MHQLDTATSSSPPSHTWNPNPNFSHHDHPPRHPPPFTVKAATPENAAGAKPPRATTLHLQRTRYSRSTSIFVHVRSSGKLQPLVHHLHDSHDFAIASSTTVRKPWITHTATAANLRCQKTAAATIITCWRKVWEWNPNSGERRSCHVSVAIAQSN